MINSTFKYLRTIIMLTLLTVALPVNASPTIGLELLWGLGASSNHKGVGSKFCKNRTYDSLKGFGVYLSDDNLEAHISNYKHDTTPSTCNRSNWALGVGPKFSTKKDGESENLYFDAGIGLSYRLNETWRDHGNFSLYNRFRLGNKLNSNSHSQRSLEFGYLQYGGFFERDHGESFLTFGLSRSDIDSSQYTIEGSESTLDDNPGNDNPGNDNPGNDNPGNDNPGNDNSDDNSDDDNDEDYNEDHDKGHGNNDGHYDPDNPGNSKKFSSLL